MQHQPIKKIHVAQVVAQIIALKNPPAIEVDIILLPPNLALPHPRRLETFGVQYQPIRFRPASQRGAFRNL